MKRAGLLRVLGTAFVFLAATGVGAQERPFHTASTAHYRVLSDAGPTVALDVARKMEAALSLYNEYLRFDLSELPLPLRVRIFRAREDYDRHLQELISESRSDFVFISYNDPARSELIGFQREAESFDASLLHYGFIQFLNARVRGVPPWLEEGMATYLEAAVYDAAANRFTFRPNFTWLDSFKAIITDPELSPRFSLDELLRQDRSAAEASIEIFYPAAWALVHFLLESPDRRFNRILWDILSALDPQAGGPENAARARARAFSWITPGELQQALEGHMLSLKSFNDLVREGVEEYGRNAPEQARERFLQAVQVRQDSFIPAYYLGLIAYQNKAYDEAARHYREAQRLGIDPALIHYALGVNAFANRDYGLAVDYLSRARELGAEAYAEKVDALLKRIEVLR